MYVCMYVYIFLLIWQYFLTKSLLKIFINIFKQNCLIIICSYSVGNFFSIILFLFGNYFLIIKIHFKF